MLWSGRRTAPPSRNPASPSGCEAGRYGWRRAQQGGGTEGKPSPSVHGGNGSKVCQRSVLAGMKEKHREGVTKAALGEGAQRFLGHWPLLTTSGSPRANPL